MEYSKYKIGHLKAPFPTQFSAIYTRIRNIHLNLLIIIAIHCMVLFSITDYHLFTGEFIKIYFFDLSINPIAYGIVLNIIIFFVFIIFIIKLIYWFNLYNEYIIQEHAKKSIDEFLCNLRSEKTQFPWIFNLIHVYLISQNFLKSSSNQKRQETTLLPVIDIYIINKKNKRNIRVNNSNFFKYLVELFAVSLFFYLILGLVLQTQLMSFILFLPYKENIINFLNLILFFIELLISGYFIVFYVNNFAVRLNSLHKKSTVEYSFNTQSVFKKILIWIILFFMGTFALLSYWAKIYYPSFKMESWQDFFPILFTNPTIPAVSIVLLVAAIIIALKKPTIAILIFIAIIFSSFILGNFYFWFEFDSATNKKKPPFSFLYITNSVIVSQEKLIKLNHLHKYASNATLNLDQKNKYKEIGYDFSGRNFSYINLENSFLIGSNFRNVNLSYANLKNTNFSYANFKQAGSSFRNVNLSYANLKNTNFSYANFKQAGLSNTNLTESEENKKCLGDNNLIGLNFEGSILNKSELCFDTKKNEYEKSILNLKYIHGKEAKFYFKGNVIKHVKVAEFDFANLENSELIGEVKGQTFLGVNFENVKIQDIKLFLLNKLYFANIIDINKEKQESLPPTNKYCYTIVKIKKDSVLIDKPKKIIDNFIKQFPKYEKFINDNNEAKNNKHFNNLKILYGYFQYIDEKEDKATKEEKDFREKCQTYITQKEIDEIQNQILNNL